MADEKINARNNSPSYRYPSCLKVCLSRGGLIRQINTNYQLEKAEPNKNVNEMGLPDIFYQILQKSVVKKLVQDESYPNEIFKQIYNFTVVSSVTDPPAYNLLTLAIESFNGYIEKFFTNFYHVLVDADDSFRGLDRNCTRLSAFELKILALIACGM